MILTKNFTLEEMTRSDTARRNQINNEPSAAVVENLGILCSRLLQPIREAWKKPIVVTSGYRCKTLNMMLGGSLTSQHMTGQAADFRTTSATQEENCRLWQLILTLDLPCDQLVWEYGSRSNGPDWIHISFGPKNRREIKYIGAKK